MVRAAFRNSLAFTLCVALALSVGCGVKKRPHGPIVTNAAYQQALKDAQKSGMVVNTAAMARPLPPPSRNAALVYTKLAAVLRMRPMSKNDEAAELKSHPPYPAPMPAELAAARGLLTGRSDVLQLVHQAASRPDCVFIRYWGNPEPQSILFPEFAVVRECARVLATESIVMACDGKGVAAVRNEALGFRLAHHVGLDGTIIAYLVRQAINSITFYALQRIMILTHGDAQVAKAVRQAIDENWQTPQVAPTLKRDVSMQLSEMEYFRSQGLQGTMSVLFEGATPPQHISGDEKQAWNKVINANGMYIITETQKMINVADLPYPSASTKMNGIEAAIDHDTEQVPKHDPLWTSDQNLDHLLAHTVIFVSAKIVENRATETALAEATRTAASLFEYKAMHGSFPATLSELKSPVPIDPFDLKPLRYRREGKGFVVYSVGPTLKYDGGIEQEKTDAPFPGAHQEKKLTETVFRYGG